MLFGIDSRAFWVLFTNCICQTAFSIVAPLIPLEFERKSIASSYVGIVFALYSIGYIVWPPVISRYADRIGMNNLISLGLGVMGLAFISFGFIEVMTNRVNILVLVSILRLIHGICCSTSYTTCFLIITNEYTDQKEKLCGYLAAMGGLGLIAGPLVGSTLCSILGFKKMFFVYGGFQVILAILVKVNMRAPRQLPVLP